MTEIEADSILNIIADKGIFVWNLAYQDKAVGRIIDEGNPANNVKIVATNISSTKCFLALHALKTWPQYFDSTKD